MNTQKAKQVLTYIVIAAIAVISTYGVMTIQGLKQDNERLLEQVSILKSAKVTVDTQAAQLQEENQALQNHPLVNGR